MNNTGKAQMSDH